MLFSILFYDFGATKLFVAQILFDFKIISRRFSTYSRNIHKMEQKNSLSQWDDRENHLYYIKLTQNTMFRMQNDVYQQDRQTSVF